MVATSYPLLDAFLTMLWIFLFIIWIWLLIMIFSDVFRSHDLSGWGKAAWVIGIIIFPFLGILLYLIVRGGKMHERQMQYAQAQETAFRDYVRDTATTGDTADQLAKLAELRDRGVISEEEFTKEKAKALGV
jgi:hypothetical protein